jgi:hypothetical protein
VAVELVKMVVRFHLVALAAVVTVLVGLVQEQLVKLIQAVVVVVHTKTHPTMVETVALVLSFFATQRFTQLQSVRDSQGQQQHQVTTKLQP